jgi:hypothetical protein
MVNGKEDPASREVARVEVYYRRLLKTSVDFERRIRDRWRQRCREKNARIAELEDTVARLRAQLESERTSVDRNSRERKLVALMVNDLGMADMEEREMVRMNEEVGALSDEELDATLAERLGVSDPSDGEALDDALRGVREPERLSDGFTGAPDMSHEARPEER